MPPEFILIAVIIFIASLTQGMTGFGFQLVAIPLLSLIVDIKYAIPLGMLCGFVINCWLIVDLRKHIHFSELKELFIGAFIGIPVGIYILSSAPEQLLRISLAVMILLFVFVSFTNIIKPVGLNSNWGYLSGILSGIFGGALNTNGPPVLIYFYLQGWDKRKFKGTLTGFFMFTSIVIIAGHIYTGLTTGNIFFDFLYYVPIVLTGIFIGTKLFNKVSNELYNKIILAALTLIALFLILR